LEDNYDYQGRSFLDPPPGYKGNADHTCFIPKKCIATYTGHTKAVQVIRFFPKIGHFILSCSIDGKVKLWDVATHKKCVQTYAGHTEAVRDICFTNDGKRFISAGFDKVIQLWDTETGKVIQTFTNKKIPFCAVFNPDEDKQNLFLVGTHQKKICQYDIVSGEIVQNYEEHLGAINTITFIDNNKKFVSTSDDKKIFIWEFGLPVVIKHISEPSMHSIPATVVHPNGKYFLGQSLDNKIAVYDCKNGFKINRKKKFVGHVNAGFSCGIDFSPDGQFLCSGDADGKLWFWDWRTAKNYRTIDAHNGKVCIDVKWHPTEPSKVATCSWDGTIKLWD
jgi:pre-mRNA-processing factor 17